jgi:hypothetical protein
MGRVVDSTLLSLDGVIGSPHLWASERLDEEARAAALEQLHMIGVGGSDEDCRDRR